METWSKDKKKFLWGDDYTDFNSDRHKLSENLIKNIKGEQSNSIMNYILEENSYVFESEFTSKTIIGLDCTSSMTHLLTNCKNTIQTMFSRAISILNEKKIK
jgi:hypothetical protein